MTDSGTIIGLKLPEETRAPKWIKGYVLIVGSTYNPACMMTGSGQVLGVGADGVLQILRAWGRKRRGK